MDNKKFVELAVGWVEACLIDVLEYVDADTIDIYVVWLSKTLQNNKALLSTDKGDGRYYEITYNGDKDEFYVDMYRKELNRAISVKETEERGGIKWN